MLYTGIIQQHIICYKTITMNSIISITMTIAITTPMTMTTTITTTISGRLRTCTGTSPTTYRRSKGKPLISQEILSYARSSLNLQGSPAI